MNIDNDKIAQAIRDVAADKIVPRFLQLEDGHVRSKSGPGDLVTIADEEAEIELTRIFKSMYTGCHVIGEEAVSSGTVTREVLQSSDDYIFIVDPVDGTGNFARGTPIFGTMVSLVKGGERLASWIFQIPRNRMIAAEKGSGVTIDGTRFAPKPKIAGDAPFKGMRAFLSRKFMPAHIRPYVDERVKEFQDVSTYMCCAWEYIEVLEGERAFSLYKRIEPWDHQAGVLLLEEAGFYTRKWDKSLYTGRDLSGGVINAANEELWDRVYREFLEKPLSDLA